MKFNFTPYIYTLIFLLGISNLIGQNLELKIITNDSLDSPIVNAISFKKKHESKSSVYNELDSVSKQLSEIGFINNHLRSVNYKDNLYSATYSLNKKTKSISIFYDSTIFDKNIIKLFSTDFNDDNFVIKLNNLEKTMNSLVAYLENKGNSFAELSLKNILLENEKLIGTLIIEKSINRKIDKIIVNEYTDFPKSFIKHYLYLKKNSVFNKSKLEYASNAIQSLPFVSEIKPPEVLFTNDSTSVYIYLQKRKSNKFDGLIGFFSDENGKLKFNGYLDLLLKNVFNKGEQFSINWKSNGEERKLFKLNIETPYIFKSKITPSASFNIYKQDSSFLSINAKLNVAYSINPQNNLSIKYSTEKSNDLNTQNVSSIKDYSNSFYGISYTYKKINPQKPFQDKFYFNFNSNIGRRTSTETSIKEKQQKHELVLNYNWTLNQKNAISIRSSNGLFISNDYLSNELYRIGGSNSIRGFNEESIFASTYSVLNLNYLYYLANESYIYSITDFAYIENASLKQKKEIYGLGFGYVYSIKSGLIDVSYAIGKQSELPFDFNNSKFHIKFIQFF